MESTHKRTPSAQLLETGFTEQQVNQLRARGIPELLDLAAAQYDCFGVDNIFSAEVEGEGMMDTKNHIQVPISPEEYLMMVEARNNYEDIRDLVNDCDDLYQEKFSKEQIMQLVARPKNIFEAIAYKCADLLMSGYHHDMIVGRMSFFTVESIEAVAQYSTILINHGMGLETILETAAKEDGHICLQEDYVRLLSPS